MKTIHALLLHFSWISCLYIILFLAYQGYSKSRFYPTPNKEHNLSRINKRHAKFLMQRCYDYRSLCLNNIVSMNDCLPLLSLVYYKTRSSGLDSYARASNWRKCFDLKLQKAMKKARLDKIIDVDMYDFGKFCDVIIMEKTEERIEEE
jgi:hypothetical protein